MAAEWSFSSCATCSGSPCCAYYTIELTGRDIHRIHARCRLPLSAFLRYYVQRQENACGFRLSPGGPKHDLGLQQRRQADPDGLHPCVFILELPGGHRRCGLYEHRPLVCRAYPAILRQGVVSFRRELPVCSPPGAYDISRVDVLCFWRAALELAVEKSIWAALVERWNAMVEQAPPGSSLSALQLAQAALEFYGRLEPLRPLAGPPWERCLTSWRRLLEHDLEPLRLERSALQNACRRGDEELLGFVARVHELLDALES